MRRGPLGGFLVGFLGLTALEAFLSGPQATNLGGVLRGAGSLVHRWTDPTVPAIPDLRTKATTGAGSSTPWKESSNPPSSTPPPEAGYPAAPAPAPTAGAGSGGGTGSAWASPTSTGTAPRLPPILTT